MVQERLKNRSHPIPKQNSAIFDFIPQTITSKMKCFRLLALLLVLLLVAVTFMSILVHSSQLNNTNRAVRCWDRERQALLNIKDELVDTYGQLTSWGNDDDKRDDCCEWRGVHCHNRSNHVTQLNLGQLQGKISTSLLELQHLRYLDLSFNDFEHAPIPEFFASLTKLRYLNLARSNFSGPIPRRIGNLSKLLYFDISYNDCYSENIDWVLSFHSLEHLGLSSTNLSKATNWLQPLSKLTSLKELYLAEGALPEISPSLLPKINGSAPLAILDLSSNSYPSIMMLFRWFSNFSGTGMTSINLAGNSMAGPISDVFEKMVLLEFLDLSQCDIQGGIPKYFGNMSSLTSLVMYGSNLTVDFSELIMNLSGPVQKKLKYLDLSWNNLSGLFPNMSGFSSLIHLRLERNQLNGSIQEGHLQLPQLDFLALSSNRLSGPIPDLSFSSSLGFLHLDNNTFNGTLTQSIGSLSQLRVLDLSFNSFLEVKFDPYWVPTFQLGYLSLRHCKLGKYFPAWIITQKELEHLDISNTGISDILPSWLVLVSPRLIHLNASNNQMYGVSRLRDALVPRSRLRATTLDISRNKISGSLDFLCYVQEWGLLDLSDNHFSSQIPDCFANFRWLRFLNLANNHLSGEIPYSFGLLSSLTLLHLRSNSLSGELPTSMRNCTSLEMIDVGDNRLIGRIPDWIGDSFPELRVLVLRSNAFYGSMPWSLCRLANLQILDISSNKISEVIPKCLQDFNAMTTDLNPDPFSNPWGTLQVPSDYTWEISNIKSFQSAYFMWKGMEVKYTNHLGLVKLIDFSNNNLAGEIPSGITKLVGLVGLNISWNNLIGPIPSDIGQLKSLNFLDFSRNHLSGGIPTSLGTLSHLGVLDLSYNDLSGRIPLNGQGLTFPVSAYVGNAGLCGRPLNKSCPGDESYQDPNSKVNSGNVITKGESEDDGFITQGFYVTLGLGFIIGFWGILGTILLNKRFRYTFFKHLDSIGESIFPRNRAKEARLWKCFQNQ
ncbi:probable LRR receptor-like serine/threonine-protein kinase At4g36180 [Sesamum indicum]|uniref:Probable LRR receptor-like serine/threonine-protein kinase At4g36180 n=1 Tax=Sesamum indicum TaxID=4182 RepID=A0A6I9SZJ5_SESIN|nr:probable LRR receptor-like serine/threonine-protein kinase At4g36180 [Sesamum indicum]